MPERSDISAMKYMGTTKKRTSQIAPGREQPVGDEAPAEASCRASRLLASPGSPPPAPPVSAGDDVLERVLDLGDVLGLARRLRVLEHAAISSSVGKISGSFASSGSSSARTSFTPSTGVTYWTYAAMSAAISGR